jgi:hypothetical protein
MAEPHTQVDVAAIREQLRSARSDPALTDVLGSRGLTVQDLAVLVQPLLKTTEFATEIIAKGFSGTDTFVFLPDERLAMFVKLGKKGIINEEVEAFNSVIKGRMPPRIAASGVEVSTKPQKHHLALQYLWAGDEHRAETLNTALKDGKLSPKQVPSFLRDLIEPMWEFHTSAGISKGMPLFYWAKTKVEKISRLLEPFAAQKPQIPALIQILHGTNRWENLRFKKSSKGYTHGDFHCSNVLAIIGNHAIRPFVVDYHLARQGQCPARDWAKLEREIKFRTLREISGNDFSAILAAVNRSLQAGVRIKTFTEEQHACLIAIEQIRGSYLEKAGARGSEIPESEYLYHLLCWELEYLFWDNIAPQSIELEAMVDSAIYTLRRLQAAVVREAATSERVAVPEHLRTWKRYDTVTLAGGAVGLFFFFSLYVSAYPYASLGSLTPASRILEIFKTIVAKYVGPQKMKYVVSYRAGSDEDDAYLHLIRACERKELTKAVPYIPRWIARGITDQDREEVEAVMAEFDREGNLINFYSSIAARRANKETIGLYPQEQMMPRAYSVVEDLFHENLYGMAPKPYIIRDYSYQLLNEIGEYENYGRESGAPIAWKLQAGTPVQHRIVLNFLDPETLYQAQYSNALLDRLMLSYPEGVVIGAPYLGAPPGDDGTQGRHSTVFPSRALLANGDIDDYLSNGAFLMFGIVSVGGYFANRRRFDPRWRKVAWIIASVFTISELCGWWLELPGSSYLHDVARLAGLDEADGRVFIVLVCTSAVIYLGMTFALARLGIHYAFKLARDQISSVLMLRSGLGSGQPTGLAIIRGTSFGLVGLGLHAIASSTAVYCRSGALTALSWIPGAEGQAIGVSVLDPMSLTLSFAFCLVVSFALCQPLRRRASLAASVTVLALYGPFIVPGLALLTPILAYSAAAAAMLGFFALFRKFDLLTAIACFLTIHTGLVSLAILVIFARTTPLALVAPLWWIVVVGLGLFLWFKPALLMLRNRALLVIRGEHAQYSTKS